MKTKLNKGFTLIELLVVIAIIALLLAILSPSLQKVKDAARSVVCRAHMRAAGVGMQIYVNEWNGWLAGPNTSGKYCTEKNPSEPLNGESTPVQNMDWISPTIGDSLGLPYNGHQRLVELLNNKMACAANKAKYDYVFTGSDVPVETYLQSKGLGAREMKYSSYSAALGFHTWPKAGAHQPVAGITMSSKYRPKISNVGFPSNKVYIMDGARYIDPADGASFNQFGYQDDGGNFMLYGPSTPLGGDPFYGLRTEMILPGYTDLEDATSRADIYIDYAFRHDQSVQVIFFDGHSEKLSWYDSLKTSYYFPPGTEITNANVTYDPTDTNGIIK